MKNIALVLNKKKNIELESANKVARELKEMGATVYSDSLGIEGTVYIDNASELFDKCEMAVVLGGDGTLLNAAKDAAIKEIPLLGINFGRLGFLVELEKYEIDDLKKVWSNDYIIETRTMLEVKVIKKDKKIDMGLALNDAIITKCKTPKMVHLSLMIDNKKVDKFYADGIIIATPTGSTAYSLSAGGPIVSPEIPLLVVTPVCPHSIAVRPVVISDEKNVDVLVEFDEGNDVMLSLDGQDGITIEHGDIVSIKKSKYTTKLIRLNDRNFYEVLKRKLSERVI